MTRPIDLPALTGLRFFMAMAVYISHVPPPEGAPAIVSTAMASGYFGVTFFFVLSGFVLAYNYFDRLRSPDADALWKFAVARFARVYPLYLLVLVIVAARQGPDPSLILHVFAVQTWHPDLAVAFGYNGPGWSIGVEFFLYAMLPLLIPVIVYVQRRWSLTWLAVGTVVVMTAIVIAFVATGRYELPRSDPDSAHRWLYRNPLLRVGDFLLGVIAARLFVAWRRGSRPGSAMIYTALAGTALLATSEGHLFSAASFDLSYAVPAVLLILGIALAPRNIVSRALAHPKLVLLGEASFALYLVHQWLKADLGSGIWAQGLTPITAAVEVGALAVVIVVSLALHFLFERPARRFVTTAATALRTGLSAARAST